jgi:serine/threonine protein kinase
MPLVNTPYTNDAHPRSPMRLNPAVVRVGKDLQFRRSDLLGEGSFSQVFFGHWRSVPVAVKRIDLSSVDRVRALLLENELRLLLEMDHPCIVGLLDILYT